MHITVLGATGTIGSRIADELEARGHDVVRASRGTGVDAHDASSLLKAFKGANIVVDCLNTEAMGRKKAREFFVGTARNVSAGAERAGVSRVVCVSIAGAADPKVHRWFGYYRGKAAQEQTYRQSAVPTTLVRSTQWFELMENLARQTTIGPLTVLPTMAIAALAAGRAAGIIADEIEKGREDSQERTLTIRGPEQSTALRDCQKILAERGEIAGRRPRVMIQMPYFGLSIARGGLIPEQGIADDLTLERWLLELP
ncbi:SDR family oxidoreductase [Nesterenkonia salmonea]|uniref:SDR family oxidoreductase n=1 Tax=Nesterenkonia salmonea TaxID=1804987 RepID=A0A5R9B893_9MICC|nr:NAD(P)-binding oxidoreductase [Nesterenkonia salmonea]TLP94189.1 SDR family oxidoreductase [Nesterenkonia salmonea]